MVKTIKINLKSIYNTIPPWLLTNLTTEVTKLKIVNRLYDVKCFFAMINCIAVSKIGTTTSELSLLKSDFFLLETSLHRNEDVTKTPGEIKRNDEQATNTSSNVHDKLFGRRNLSKAP